jgi:hypothetical protein
MIQIEPKLYQIPKFFAAFPYAYNINVITPWILSIYSKKSNFHEKKTSKIKSDFILAVACMLISYIIAPITILVHYHDYDMTILAFNM